MFKEPRHVVHLKLPAVAQQVYKHTVTKVGRILVKAHILGSVVRYTQAGQGNTDDIKGLLLLWPIST